MKVACVDINPATVTKLADRGSHQTVGVVTDAEPFLRALVTELKQIAACRLCPQEAPGDGAALRANGKRFGNHPMKTPRF